MAYPRFGKPIDKSNADRLFEKFIRIKERSLPKLRKVLADDPEALRYYCGTSDDDSKNILNDWAFVFDKAALDHVMKKITDGEAQGVFIFYGAGSNAVEGGESGKPTLMIFPAAYNEGPTEALSGFKLFSKDGAQHPGSGGGEMGTLEAAEIKLPDGFKKGQYLP